jgi:hypothetical protein
MRYSLRHFTDVFKIRSANGEPPVLIGGQAVNYWAELYSTEEPGLIKWQPFASEDIDFQGNRQDVHAIASQLGRVALFPRPVEMTALAGMIPLRLGDLNSQIEVIRSVPGVPGNLLQETALEAIWEQHRIRVIDPISLLRYRKFSAPTIDELFPFAKSGCRDGKEKSNHFQQPPRTVDSMGRRKTVLSAPPTLDPGL